MEPQIIIDISAQVINGIPFEDFFGFPADIKHEELITKFEDKVEYFDQLNLEGVRRPAVAEIGNWMRSAEWRPVVPQLVSMVDPASKDPDKQRAIIFKAGFSLHWVKIIDDLLTPKMNPSDARKIFAELFPNGTTKEYVSETAEVRDDTLRLNYNFLPDVPTSSSLYISWFGVFSE